MTDATAVPGSPANTAPEPAPDRRDVYKAGGGRRTFFAFLFLLLLPFYISLGPMLWARVSQGHWTGTPGLLIIAICFSILMFLILIELMFSVRTRIELGEDAVKMTLPSGRGPTPMLRYARHEVPYDQIAGVETRREIYGGTLAPVLLTGARILTKEGKTVPIGYVSDANVDPTFPYPDIAERIALRAGVKVAHRGNVRRSFKNKLLGIKAGDDQHAPIDEMQIDELNQRHNKVMLGLIGGLVALMVIGMVADIFGDDGFGSQSVPAATAPAKLPAKK